MTTEARLRKLLAAATPGATQVRWIAEEWGPDATILLPDGARVIVGDALYHRESMRRARLIVEAVNALPKLLAVVAAARDVVAEYDKTHLRHDVGYEAVADAVDELFGPLAALDQEGDHHG